MINSITIENFKGISEPVTINFKPITLLFGANSVGKSSVFHAMYYLHKILTTAGNNVDKVIYYDYGDFLSMVHNNDPNKDICLTLNCKISTDDTHYYALNTIVNELSNYSLRYNDFESLTKNNINHKFTHPEVVVKISVGLIASYDIKIPVIKQIDISLLSSNICIDYADNKISINKLNKLLIYLSNSFEGLCGCTDCDNILDSLGVILDTQLKEFEETINDESGIHSIGTITCNNDNIVLTYEGVPFDSSELYADTYHVYKYNSVQLHQQPFLLKFVNILFFGIFDNIIADLNNAIYINPLRDMPSRDNSYSIVDETNLNRINNWLGANNFDTGLYFENEKQFSVSLTNKEFNQIHSISKKELIERIHPVSQQTLLKRISSNHKVSLPDVGFGISQLLPILEAYTRTKHSYSYVFVEQPEIHLHPRMQTVLADLIISWCSEMEKIGRIWISDTENKTMIETHSEHLLLRLLRRIRETAAGELPEGCSPVTPDQVAIHYLERKDGIVCIRKLEISPDGDSFGEWPRGFFEERAGELF